MKRVWWVLIVLMFVVGVVMIVLLAGGIANNELVMQVKYNYFRTTFPYLSDNVWLAPGDIVPLRKREILGQEKYEYTLVGRFEEIDWEKRLIKIKGRGGEIYNFLIRIERVQENLYSLEYEDTNYQINDTVPQILSIDRGSGEDIPSPFMPGDVMMITWDDERTLSEIQNDLEVDPERVINTNFETMVAQRIQRLVEGGMK